MADVSYNKLWKQLIDRELTKTEFQQTIGISSSTLAKLSSNQHVSMDVLVRICRSLECQISDVCEVLDAEGEIL